MERFIESLQSLDSSYNALVGSFESQLSELQAKRDFLVGRIIAEETKTYDMCEHEKLGCAFRWYKVKSKEMARQGYHYQLEQMFKTSNPRFFELKEVG